MPHAASCSRKQHSANPSRYGIMDSLGRVLDHSRMLHSPNEHSRAEHSVTYHICVMDQHAQGFLANSGSAVYAAVLGTACRTAQHSATQHSTAQHSTAQNSTEQHCTAQYSTAQCSFIQHMLLNNIGCLQQCKLCPNGHSCNSALANHPATTFGIARVQC